MKTIHLIIIFAILVGAQLFVPSKMIWDQEQALAKGTMYKFRTQPIDPTDPFRGKYITLNYEMSSFITSKGEETYAHGDKIYLYLKEDKDGFAQIDKVSKTLLENNRDYILTEVISGYDDKINFELPFDRFYMEESKAPKAEKAYNEANRTNAIEDVYALIYILEDTAVLGDVIIQGQSISDFVND